MLNKVILVKIGGSTLGSHDTTIEDLVKMQKDGKSLVVVHGGGKLITDWLQKQNISTKFVDGERVTDKPTLEVATAVLAGLVNKDIVASINGLGGKAVGISGVDGNLIEGKIGNIAKGYVGAVARVNPKILETLLKAGFIPVIAPIGLHAINKQADVGGGSGVGNYGYASIDGSGYGFGDGSYGQPPTLNFNADTVAGEIAAAIGAERLIFLTDVPGINDKSGKLLPHLSKDEAEALINSGVASGGMIPKIRACLTALTANATTCIIDGRLPHILVKELTSGAGGTVIQA